jgi:asparagine synthase (glutamine-hydrolysing)
MVNQAEIACTPLWAHASPGAVPGKATHVAWLVGILNHLEGYRRERTHRTVWPLMAQPLVELCLRIPSWLWSRGGQNRALARRAYVDVLPPEILSRRSKGTPDCFVVELFEANRKRIRDLLCDGFLAANGIVDREEIARFLVDEGPVRGLGYWRIMTLTDVEAWLQTVSTGAHAA